MVLGFFSALRSALYGEQQKEAQQSTTLRQQHQQPHPTQHRRGSRRGGLRKFGILEKVEEVGVENLLSASPLPEERSFFFRSSCSRESSESRQRNQAVDDELELLQPGSLTINTAASTPASQLGAQRKPTVPLHQQNQPRSLDTSIGELKEPSFAQYGRPSLDPRALGSLPPNVGSRGGSSSFGETSAVSGRGPGRHPAQLPGMLGVPGTPGTGALLMQQQHAGSVRPDLGSIPIMTSDPEQMEQQNLWQSGGFIGTIANVFFGRKGGLL